MNEQYKSLLHKIHPDRSLFRWVALLLILFSLASSLESRAYQFVLATEVQNSKLLLTASGIKLVLATVADLDAPIISSEAKEMGGLFNSIENLLLISNIATTLQLVLLKISKAKILGLIALLLLAGTFVKEINSLSKKLLILLLFINPGVTIYSIGMHGLSNELSKELHSELAQKLTVITDQMQAEESELSQKHKKQLEHNAHDSKIKRYFEDFKENVVYKVKSTVDKAEGEIKKIRLILRSGPDILRGVVKFCAHMLIFSFFMPLLYLYALYQITIKLFDLRN